MIDFHCHLDLYEKPDDVLRQIDSKMQFVLSVTTTPQAWDGNKTLLADSIAVRLAAGLHPELVGGRWTEVDILCGLISETNFVGEIGLDGSPNHRSSFGKQHTVLMRVIQECERLGGRILSLHSRRAASAVLDLLSSSCRKSTPVLHWFSGSYTELAVANALGCWFSVGPAMLKTRKGFELVSRMPRDKVLTETDGPFTTTDNGRMMPWDVRSAVRILAGIWNTTIEESHAQIGANLSRLLG